MTREPKPMSPQEAVRAMRRERLTRKCRHTTGQVDWFQFMAWPWISISWSFGAIKSIFGWTFKTRASATPWASATVVIVLVVLWSNHRVENAERRLSEAGLERVRVNSYNDNVNYQNSQANERNRRLVNEYNREMQRQVDDYNRQVEAFNRELQKRSRRW